MNTKKWIHWSEDKIVNEIKNVASLLNINRMPSRSEIESIHGDAKLTNKISKTGGFRYWAKKLNLEIKASESNTGYKYELTAIKLLQRNGFEVEKMSLRHPYDLLVNGSVKVDVKISNAGYIKKDRVHTFRLAKKYATCDIYMFFVIDEDKNIEKLLIIPSHKLKIMTLCMGKDSKYNKYIDRWDYIDKLTKTYCELG